MMGESAMDILDRQLADGEIGIREYQSLSAAPTSNKPKSEPKVGAKIVSTSASWRIENDGLHAGCFCSFFEALGGRNVVGVFQARRNIAESQFLGVGSAPAQQRYRGSYRRLKYRASRSKRLRGKVCIQFVTISSLLVMHSAPLMLCVIDPDGWESCSAVDDGLRRAAVYSAKTETRSATLPDTVSVTRPNCPRQRRRGNHAAAI